MIVETVADYKSTGILSGIFSQNFVLKHSEI